MVHLLPISISGHFLSTASTQKDIVTPFDGANCVVLLDEPLLFAFLSQWLCDSHSQAKNVCISELYYNLLLNCMDCCVPWSYQTYEKTRLTTYALVTFSLMTNWPIKIDKPQIFVIPLFSLNDSTRHSFILGIYRIKFLWRNSSSLIVKMAHHAMEIKSVFDSTILVTIFFFSMSHEETNGWQT